MPVWTKFKQIHGFQLVGQLNTNDDDCQFWHTDSLSHFGVDVPSTYVLVLVPGLDSETETVVYVGMAGKGWTVRAGQHNAGLRRVKAGKESKPAWLDHWAKRKNWLREGRQILVYERAAQTMEMFGKRVSLQHAEEQALLKLFRPEFNRAGTKTS